MTQWDRGGADPTQGRCPFFQEGSGLAPQACCLSPLGSALGPGLCWGSGPLGGGIPEAVGRVAGDPHRASGLVEPTSSMWPCPQHPSLGSELIALQATSGAPGQVLGVRATLC